MHAGAVQALSEPSGKKEPNMRSIPLVLAAFVASGPAAAQSWEEYSYPKYAFAVTFPAKPQVEGTTYQVADIRLYDEALKLGPKRAYSL